LGRSWRQKQTTLVNWAEVFQPKDQGGLGIINTKIVNIALMVNWPGAYSRTTLRIPYGTISSRLSTHGRVTSYLRHPMADLPSGAVFTRLNISSSWGLDIPCGMVGELDSRLIVVGQ
jgi:hypothetical protein